MATLFSGYISNTKQERQELDIVSKLVCTGESANASVERIAERSYEGQVPLRTIVRHIIEKDMIMRAVGLWRIPADIWINNYYVCRPAAHALDSLFIPYTEQTASEGAFSNPFDFQKERRPRLRWYESDGEIHIERVSDGGAASVRRKVNVTARRYTAIRTVIQEIADAAGLKVRGLETVPVTRTTPVTNTYSVSAEAALNDIIDQYLDGFGWIVSDGVIYVAPENEEVLTAEKPAMVLSEDTGLAGDADLPGPGREGVVAIAAQGQAGVGHSSGRG